MVEHLGEGGDHVPQTEEVGVEAEHDVAAAQDEALVELYRRVRPGEPPTVEAGTALLDNFYFNSKRYDLAKVGRYKINKKLGVDGPLEESTLTLADVVATVKYLAALHKGEEEFAVRIDDHGGVWFTVRVFSRAAWPVLRIAGPLVPLAQRLIVRALARATRRLLDRVVRRWSGPPGTR